MAHVLDPKLHHVRLCDRGAKLLGAQWAPPVGNARAESLTFADIDGSALTFQAGRMQRPMKRMLCYQAHLARQYGGERGWRQLVFEDFWSEGLSYVDKVKAWLEIE